MRTTIFVWDRRHRRRPDDRRVAQAVEIATAATPKWKNTTRLKLTMTFRMPAIPRHTIGVRVSPWLRNMADAKLYSSTPGKARKIIRRYRRERGMSSSGTIRRPSMGSARISPTTSMDKPASRAKKRDVWTAAVIFSRFPAPVSRAITTLAPREMPIKKVMINATRGTLLPTAAMASFPTNCPIMTASMALKSCCIMPVAARNRANFMVLPAMGPWVISTEPFIKITFRYSTCMKTMGRSPVPAPFRQPWKLPGPIISDGRDSPPLYHQ
jgi:hypothetical protein